MPGQFVSIIQYTLLITDCQDNLFQLFQFTLLINDCQDNLFQLFQFTFYWLLIARTMPRLLMNKVKMAEKNSKEVKKKILFEYRIDNSSCTCLHRLDRLWWMLQDHIIRWNDHLDEIVKEFSLQVVQNNYFYLVYALFFFLQYNSIIINIVWLKIIYIDDLAFEYIVNRHCLKWHFVTRWHYACGYYEEGKEEKKA